MSLNPRQTRFVQEYLKDSNATQAAIRAGYSEKGADVQGSRLLGDVRISAEIAKVGSKIATRNEITVERVLREYGRIAFLNPQSFYDADGRMLSVKEMPEDAARAIAGIEELDQYERDSEGERVHIGVLKKIRLTPKVAALEGLARHLGMFQDANVSATAFQINIHLGD